MKPHNVMLTASAILFTGVMIAKCDTVQGEETEQPKSLYERVQEYLVDGIGKEEHRQTHYAYEDSLGNIHYNRLYVFGTDSYVEQYDFIGIQQKDTLGGIVIRMFAYPSSILYQGEVWKDFMRDGVNGNEDKIDREEVVKKPKGQEI